MTRLSFNRRQTTREHDSETRFYALPKGRHSRTLPRPPSHMNVHHIVYANQRLLGSTYFRLQTDTLLRPSRIIDVSEISTDRIFLPLPDPKIFGTLGRKCFRANERLIHLVGLIFYADRFSIINNTVQILFLNNTAFPTRGKCVIVLGYNRRQLHTLSEYAGGMAFSSNSYISFSSCECFTIVSFAVCLNTSK